jgi:hypothetical protein
MPNAVKYKTGNLTGSLQKGNVALGVSGSLGPTSTTGWYNGPNPPTSGLYQIIETAASGDPDVYCPQNDAELIKFARWKGATGADTGSAAAVLAWIGTQTNLMAANFQYEGIVTDGLVLNVDAGFVGSYPTTGTTLYDLSGNNRNETLTNGPTYNSANSGGIVYDGIDDVMTCDGVNDSFFNSLYPNGISILTWIKLPSDFSIPNGDGRSILYRGSGGASNNFWHFSINANGGNPVLRWWIGGGGSYTPWLHLSSTTLNVNTFYHCVLTWTPISSTQATTKMYLNNNEIYTNTANKGEGLSLSTTDILGNFPSGGWSPQMTQYNLLIYNRALLSTEVTQNYNAQKARFGL